MIATARTIAMHHRWWWRVGVALLLATCLWSDAPPRPPCVFDAATKTLITCAARVVYLIPFSHWDTDWHNDFSVYAKAADRNILNAMILAKQEPRFRYTLEQPLFVQHFWDQYPDQRAELKRLVQNRQFSFAWAGITQPETSLVAPAIQVRNLQLGQAWIAQTFGRQFIPRTMWQSDAFGNSAALPLFLNQLDIPYLYIGRWQGRCDPDYQKCTPLPHAFYWKTPAAAARVLAVYTAYPTAWSVVYKLTDPGEQVVALRKVVDRERERTDSRFLLLPLGFDFYDPAPTLMAMVDRWNAENPDVALIVSDPETAFNAIATQALPEVTLDLNPIWQGFYASRPQAKIADKESEYFLSTGDKFGLLTGAPQSSAWLTATLSAHYDNIGGVSYDKVWEGTQRPRFVETVATAATDLAATLAYIASGVAAPVLLFNPTSWPRSEIIEFEGELLDPRTFLGPGNGPVQRIGPHTVAMQVAEVPAIGFTTLQTVNAVVTNPATTASSADQVTLSNGLVAVTLDGAHGGSFSQLHQQNGPELLATFGDDITYHDDKGDVYGARFGEERARESQTTASLTVLANGPLLARVQAVFTLGGQLITKTVTMHADSPRIDVALRLKALPETTAIVHIPTTIAAQTRTDDLGFAAIEHPLDNRPIVAGDVTYRRQIFYPITYWSDLAAADKGLTLITHGLQGLGGMGQLNLMLVRWASQDAEGLTDPDYHTFRYAYLPHTDTARESEPWRAAYAFNQPLIPVWRAGDKIHVQLPFDTATQTFAITAKPHEFCTPFSLLAAESGLIADVYREDGQTKAVVINYDPATPSRLRVGAGPLITLPSGALTITTLDAGALLGSNLCE